MASDKSSGRRIFDRINFKSRVACAKAFEKRILVASIVLMISAAIAPAAVFASSVTAVSIQPNAPILAGNAFSPNPVTIAPGDSIMWTNNDSNLHLLTNDPGAADLFTTSLLSPQATFTALFPNSGSVPYHCEIHPQMTGTINVSMFVLPESSLGIAALLGSSLAALGGFLFIKQRTGADRDSTELDMTGE